MYKHSIYPLSSFFMIDLKNMDQDTLIQYIAQLWQNLKRYKASAQKSSDARFNAPLWVSRAKVTTLNARMERNHEMLEQIKDDIKEAVKYL